ncbi:MAG: hypothetical protein HRU35_02975 [Rickettsiaceae bacterium]|nr:hypothetical protein [Rickettsiaceae bacterium]
MNTQHPDYKELDSNQKYSTLKNVAEQSNKSITVIANMITYFLNADEPEQFPQIDIEKVSYIGDNPDNNITFFVRG